MNSDIEQLRIQLFEAEGKIAELRQRLEEVLKAIEPFLLFAKTCKHLPDEERIACRPIQKMSGYQMVNLEARHFKALADWDREGEGK